jgi:GNAT superfamily N-acetyltransferase
LDLEYREPKEHELLLLIEMFADDKLGAKREDVSTPINKQYISAFNQIQVDPNNEIIVAILNDKFIGMMQLTYIPSLGIIGSKRSIIGGVRVHSQYRGQGFGTKMIKWGIERSKNNGCRIVQVTSDKKRPEAIHFYKNLGFAATHEGLRLKINEEKAEFVEKFQN